MNLELQADLDIFDDGGEVTFDSGSTPRKKSTKTQMKNPLARVPKAQRYSPQSETSNKTIDFQD